MKITEVPRYTVTSTYNSQMEPICCCNWRSTQALSFWFIIQLINSFLMIFRNIYVHSVCDESCRISPYFNNSISLKIEQDGIIKTSEIEEFYFWSNYTKFIAKHLAMTVSIRALEVFIEVFVILVLTGQTRPHKVLGRVKVLGKNLTDLVVFRPSSIMLIACVEQVFRFICEIVVFVIDFGNMIEQKERLAKMELNLYFHSYFLHKSYGFVMQLLFIVCWPLVVYRIFGYQRYLVRKEFDERQSFGSSSTSFIQNVY